MTLLSDCRHALRVYGRTPGQSLIAIGVLAAGISFVTAVFSLYVDLTLRPPAGFEQSNRIASVGQQVGLLPVSIPYRIAERMSSDMATVDAAALSLARPILWGSESEQTTSENAELVSREFFSGLRPRIALGRGLRAEDHASDAEPVAVISYRLWRERFGANPDVLGTQLHISPSGWHFGQPSQAGSSAQFRIVGVMSDALPGLAWPEASLWLPLERAVQLFVGDEASLAEQVGILLVRRRAGVSAAAVAGEFSARYLGQNPELSLVPGGRLEVMDGIVYNFDVQRDAKRELELLLAGSVLLALVAAMNVSLFLLSRAPGRRRELGIRMAVGAPVRRLARQLATEAGLLVAVAAVIGMGLSIWLSIWAREFTVLRIARWTDVTLMDWRVLGLSAAVLLLLTLVVSLAPIVGIRRLGIGVASRQVTARASPAQRIAGTVQVIVAGTIGGVAIAFGWYIGTLTFSHPGYETTDRYVVEGLADQQMFAGGEGVFIEAARRREIVEAIPGVHRVAFGHPVPGRAGDLSRRPVTAIQNPDDPSRAIDVFTGGPLETRFLDLLGFRLLHGRAPEQGETAVVLVNRTLARMLWGRDNVAGELLPQNFLWGNERAEVIGVLEDLALEHPSAGVAPVVFATLGNPFGRPGRFSAVVEATLTATELRQALDRLASDGLLDVQIGDVVSLRRLRHELLREDRERSFLTIATAVAILLLAAFGFYGTQHHLVAAGRREYAIRSSLGAGPRALGRLVLLRGCGLALPGLFVGALLAFIVVIWARDRFLSPDISPGWVTAWVVAGLTMLFAAACLGPALMAMRTPPAPLLRED